MAPPSLQIGTTLNNQYQIIRILGQGGFGEVYLGQTFSGKPVAIKRNLETSPESLDQFRREAQLLRPLSQPNLVRVEDYFEDPSGSQFLVMEYVAGDDLFQLADKRQGPFPEAQVLRWGVILCGVLAYLHGRTPPIIHRDIKPQNVKIENPGGRVVLVDFGIAKEFRPGQKTQLGARACTDGFSPLEQYGTGTTAQSDIYALGATLFFLLTLQLPDKAPERAINQLPFNLQRLNPTISQPTIFAIQKAMELNPQDRFRTATEMQQALNHALRAHGSLIPASKPVPAATMPAVICPNCGAQNRGSARVCSHCGKLLAAGITSPVGTLCPNCGAVNRGSARICSQCGKLLAMPFPSWVPSRPFPPVPSRPATAPLILPTAPGQCPNCGHINPPDETFCLDCGYQLQTPPPPGPAPVPSRRAPTMQPVPASVPLVSPTMQPVSVTTQDQTVAGWALFATGVIGILFGLFQIYQGWLVPLGFGLIVLGIVSAIAGRDLLNLFSSTRYNVPDWLAALFGDPNRGRRWGTIAAVLWVIIGITFAWLVIPLALAGGMAYVLTLLIGEQFVRSVGGHYSRPGLVTVIGWLLAFSGVGTVPGVALLIPKRWAPRWAKIVLSAIALLALGGIGFALINLTSTSSASSNFILPGMPLQIAMLNLLALCVCAIPTSIAAIRYLDQVLGQLNYTQTAMRRELNVAAWMLFATGWAALLFSLWEIGAPIIGQFFWVGIGIGTLAIWSARDLLNLGARWFPSGSLLVGDIEIGRRKGIIAAIALAICSIVILKQIVPVIFLIVSIFILRVLMGPQTVLICGGKLSAPAGVTLIAWLLAPTGIGTPPGILMLKADVQGWRWARFVLVLLGIGGAVGAFLGLASAIPSVSSDTTLAWAVATSGAALAVGSGIAVRYLDSPVVRQYFGV